MSQHFHKLYCGPRSLLMIAAWRNRPIDPDALWERFAADLGRATEAPGAVAVSTLLDMSRAFGFAQHLDVTHDVDQVVHAFSISDTAGVLMTWERFPTQPGPAEFAVVHHIVAVRSVVGIAPQRKIVVESPNKQGTEALEIPEHLLPQLMGAFLILFGRPHQ